MADDIAALAAPRLPNLVIVGVSKAGTTSLFSYLGQHPEICASDVKEPRYFTPLRYGEELEPADTYSPHFRHCNGRAYAMEATAGYFYGGETLARGLGETCPEARTLVSLREPEARCWSFFQFVRAKTRIPKDMTFDAYLDRCEELRRAGVGDTYENKAFMGLTGGCYAEWLDAWVGEFGERFRVVFFDDVAEDPRGAVKGICEWLDIDSDVVDEFQFLVENKTEQYRNKVLQRAGITLNRRAESFFRRHETTKRTLRRYFYGVNKASSSAKMSTAQRARLTDFYRPYNKRLSEQLSAVGLSIPASWSRPS